MDRFLRGDIRRTIFSLIAGETEKSAIVFGTQHFHDLLFSFLELKKICLFRVNDVCFAQSKLKSVDLIKLI